MIFQTEKQLKEFGDKLPADKKQPIEAALQELKDAHKAQDITAINSAIDELEQRVPGCFSRNVQRPATNKAAHNKEPLTLINNNKQTMVEKTKK